MIALESFFTGGCNFATGALALTLVGLLEDQFILLLELLEFFVQVIVPEFVLAMLLLHHLHLVVKIFNTAKVGVLLDVHAKLVIQAPRF